LDLDLDGLGAAVREALADLRGLPRARGDPLAGLGEAEPLLGVLFPGIRHRPSRPASRAPPDPESSASSASRKPARRVASRPIRCAQPASSTPAWASDSRPKAWPSSASLST